MGAFRRAVDCLRSMFQSQFAQAPGKDTKLRMQNLLKAIRGQKNFGR